jgi:hypothetical protein
MDYFDGFDEYNDWDATSCANGDYNAWEEEQVFLDGIAWDERYRDQDDVIQSFSHKVVPTTASWLPLENEDWYTFEEIYDHLGCDQCD